MTPQQELDIYLGKTTLGDKTIVDIYLNKPIQEPTPNNDNVTQINDAQNSSIWNDIVKKDLPDFSNVYPADIRPQIPEKKITDPIKETDSEEEDKNKEKGVSKNTSPGTKTYKKHFYITLGIACILLLALIFKK